MSSVGAASAAQQGRGTRSFASEDPEYQDLLPQLPTGRIVLNTVFLHADVRARPYRVEHFRDALASLGLLADVIALGAYQMSHVWAVTFKSDEGAKKLSSAKNLKVNEHRCIVVDPANQAVRLKLHWMLHNVSDEDIRTALLPFGKVTDVFREKWRAQGVQDKASSTRAVSLVLKTGMTVEDLPHQLRVAGEQTLVVVPGRAPLCLKCRNTGHVRRDCRVPKCAVCRRYGHQDTECVKTYASVAGPALREDVADLLMDEADVDEASRVLVPPADIVATPYVAAAKATKVDQQVKLRLHWLLYGVADEDVRMAFAAFGKVEEVSRERWRVEGMATKTSTTRTVILKLKSGMKMEDLPHQIRVGGELALVVVPGPVTSFVAAEHVMDVAEAEDAAKGTLDKVSTATASGTTPLGVVSKVADTTVKPSGMLQVATAEVQSTRSSSEDPPDNDATAMQQEEAVLDCDRTSTLGAPVKRPHDQTKDRNDGATGTSEGPATKTPLGRRTSLKPKPNVPPERKPADKVAPTNNAGKPGGPGGG
ncbi:uncharacterized protein LOC142563436 [Dermacentor variabilis]|uniref:uncharacterized protein LOC142563436 n=1 Tax=Dermacentor variabilis TaxID=34621 RepID=UPI003F5AED0E